MWSHDRIKKQICFDLRFGELPCEKNNYKRRYFRWLIIR